MLCSLLGDYVYSSTHIKLNHHANVICHFRTFQGCPIGFGDNIYTIQLPNIIITILPHTTFSKLANDDDTSMYKSNGTP